MNDVLFALRVMFQRGEKLCAVPTAGLQEEKHSDYVSMTWWMSMPWPTHNTANGALVYSNHGFTFLLAWMCLDFKSVFRRVIILKLSPFFFFFVMCNHFLNVDCSLCYTPISELSCKFIVTKCHRVYCKIYCNIIFQLNNKTRYVWSNFFIVLPKRDYTKFFLFNSEPI